LAKKAAHKAALADPNHPKHTAAVKAQAEHESRKKASYEAALKDPNHPEHKQALATQKHKEELSAKAAAGGNTGGTTSTTNAAPVVPPVADAPAPAKQNLRRRRVYWA